MSSLLILINALFLYGAHKGFSLGVDSARSSTRDIKFGDTQQSEALFTSLKSEILIFEDLNYEIIQIESADGLALRGYFLPSEAPSDKLAVLAHGFSLNAKTTGKLASYFHSQGFHVFAADARAHGESEGRYRGMGWLDRKDYLKWLDVLIDKLGTETEIVLQGTSMGGATVTSLSGEVLPGNVKAIIEDCGYTSVRDIFRYQIKRQMPLFPVFPTVDLSSRECKLRAGYSYAEASALEQVKRSKTPILFVHGENDTFVPVEMAYRLYDAARCEKELWVVPGAGHAGAYDAATEEYQLRISEFCNKYMN